MIIHYLPTAKIYLIWFDWLDDKHKLQCTVKCINSVSSDIKQEKQQILKFKLERNIKAGIGSLFFVVFVQKLYNNLSAYCNLEGLKEHQTSAPLIGSVFKA